VTLQGVVRAIEILIAIGYKNFVAFYSFKLMEGTACLKETACLAMCVKY